MYKVHLFCWAIHRSILRCVLMPAVKISSTNGEGYPAVPTGEDCFGFVLLCSDAVSLCALKVKAMLTFCRSKCSDTSFEAQVQT